MKNNIYKIKAKVWQYPGFAGWHFVDIDKKTSALIKKRFSHLKKGWGSLPVTVKLGKSVWKTSIFPSKGDYYLLALKAAIRKKEHIVYGDTINFSIKIKKNN